MKVDLIAHTHVVYPGIEPHMPKMLDDWISSDADKLAEFAGRSCYQSFHKPNPKTATNPAYLANILEQGHESVLEHSSATFYVTGVSRALTHELIRHRHLSFSELSQRFVNVEDAELVFPPALANDVESQDDLIAAGAYAQSTYEEIVHRLLKAGLSRKQAREAARAVMPNATETRIVVTGNMRAWRDVITKRFSVHADAEIREFAGEVLRQLKLIAPGQFQDFPDKPFGSEEN